MDIEKIKYSNIQISYPENQIGTLFGAFIPKETRFRLLIKTELPKEDIESLIIFFRKYKEEIIKNLTTPKQ